MITAPQKARAAEPGEVVAALDKADCRSNCSPDTAVAQAGKWLAMQIYNADACDLAETQAAFDFHPEWRPA